MKEKIDSTLVLTLIISLLVHLLLLDLISFEKIEQTVQQDQHQIQFVVRTGVAEVARESQNKADDKRKKSKDNQEKKIEKIKNEKKKEVNDLDHASLNTKEKVKKAKLEKNSNKEEIDQEQNGSSQSKKEIVEKESELSDKQQLAKEELMINQPEKKSENKLHKQRKKLVELTDSNLSKGKFNLSKKKNSSEVDSNNRIKEVTKQKNNQTTEDKDISNQNKGDSVSEADSNKKSKSEQPVDLTKGSTANVKYPKLSGNQPPNYPEKMRQRGIEGKVKLKVLVTSKGLVEELKVISSSGYSKLDQAAKKSVIEWRFDPATKEDQAIASWIIIPIRFKLK